MIIVFSEVVFEDIDFFFLGLLFVFSCFRYLCFCLRCFGEGFRVVMCRYYLLSCFRSRSCVRGFLYESLFFSDFVGGVVVYCIVGVGRGSRVCFFD